MIVVDASAVVCLLSNDPYATTLRLRQRIRGEPLHAPHLLDIEVTHVLRRFVLASRLTAGRASAILADLAVLRLVRHPHYPHLERIWQLRANITAYDAAYVSLAEFLDAPLVTLDARTSRAGSGATIEVF